MKTSFSAGTSEEEILTKEFLDKDGKPDLALSLYEIEQDELIQCCSEHLAMVRKEPPRDSYTVGFFDLHELLKSVQACPTDPEPFRFISARHRETVDCSDAEIKALAGAIKKDAWRLKPVPRAHIKKYVQDKAANSDPEWKLVLAAEDKKEWAKFARQQASAPDATQPSSP